MKSLQFMASRSAVNWAAKWWLSSLSRLHPDSCQPWPSGVGTARPACPASPRLTLPMLVVVVSCTEGTVCVHTWQGRRAAICAGGPQRCEGTGACQYRSASAYLVFSSACAMVHWVTCRPAGRQLPLLA